MSPTGVTPVERGPQQVSRRAVVDAPAAELFAIVADPHRHHELDGSGTVQAAVSGPERLAKGDRFSVKMVMYGVPYRITSTVTALEPDELVEWKHPLGHRWRWELRPTASGATEVTETFDYSTAPGAWVYELLRFPAGNAEGIEKTLSALRSRFAG